MARCIYCGKEMLNNHSCLPKIIINERVYDRIKFGDENEFKGSRNRTRECKDCGCLLGQFHHFGCSIEEHPVTRCTLLPYILSDKAIRVIE